MKDVEYGDYFLSFMHMKIMCHMATHTPSMSMLFALRNLSLICREIVNQGGFPKGIKLLIELPGEEDDGDVKIGFTWPGADTIEGMMVPLGDETYADASCFSDLVKEMITLAVSVRERNQPSN